MRAGLKEAILSNYGTQKAFAQVLGVSDTVVSRIVCGTRNPGTVTRELWSALLNVDQGELFKEQSND